MQFLKTLFGKPDTTMQQVQSDTVTLEYHKMVIEAHRDEVDNLRAESYEAARRAEAARANANKLGKVASEAIAEREVARAKLRQIAALETPGCAPAAKRMARIAREALPEYAAEAA